MDPDGPGWLRMTMKQFQKISRDHRLDQGEKMDFDQFAGGSNGKGHGAGNGMKQGEFVNDLLNAHVCAPYVMNIYAFRLVQGNVIHFLGLFDLHLIIYQILPVSSNDHFFLSRIIILREVHPTHGLGMTLRTRGFGTCTARCRCHASLEIVA